MLCAPTMPETKTRSTLQKWILLVDFRFKSWSPGPLHVLTLQSREGSKKQIVLVAVLLLMMIQATCASESEQQNPTCSAGRRPDNTFVYQLSHTPWTSKCITKWETEDDINLAIKLKFDPKLVVGVTNRSITVKNCTTNLRFRWQCAQIREQVNCSLDCSGPAHLGGLQPPTVNTTHLCCSEGHCVEQCIVFSVVGVISIIAVIAAILGGIWKKKCTKRSADKTTTYNAEDDKVKLEEGLIDHRD